MPPGTPHLSGESRPSRPELADLDNAALAGVVRDDGTSVPFLRWAANAERVNQTYVQANVGQEWHRSYRAYRNHFFDGSKYLTENYKTRSRLFRPKTRIAVRKQLAATAQALFSTSDVVSVAAEYDDDPVADDAAQVIHHLLNYRLDRTSVKAGIPWFPICMGAAFDAIVAGITVSKQFWEFEQIEGEEMEPATDPATGLPILDPATGLPIPGNRPKMITVKDRPMILPLPPENAILDMGAPWYDPAQLGAYLIIAYPYERGDLEQAIEASSTGAKGGQAWLPVDPAVLEAVRDDYDAKGIRQARDGGQDRFGSEVARPAQAHNIVWVHENFFRYRGEDYQFWSVGTRAYLSEVRPTRQVYPALGGERPYVIGVGAIEPHRLYPQSHVSSWQPLQMEANDLANLRLDALKQAISPIAKIRQGSVFDVKALNNRGAGGTNIQVRSMDDLDFASWPMPGGQAYLETNHLNADMDDLSGTFSQGSVSTNRQMGETVGGMRLLNGTANAVSEYDLRVFVETWVERALRQTMKNLQFYETDETALMVAGKRAKVRSVITDEMMMTEVSCRVDVGIGATDPMQRLAKLRMALEMLVGAVPFLDQRVKVKAEEIIPEIMGAAGYKDGMKFFEFAPPGEDMDPKLKIEMEKIQIDQARVALDRVKAMMEDRREGERIQTDRDNAELAAQVDVLTDLIDQIGQRRRAELQAKSAESRTAIQSFTRHAQASEKAQKSATRR